MRIDNTDAWVLVPATIAYLGGLLTGAWVMRRHCRKRS